jgi:hypothetical protein
MKPYHYYMRPNNMAYHNLCSDTTPPPGIASLLGLGLKFCIESPRPNQGLDLSILRFRRSVRLHFHFSNQEEGKESDGASASTEQDDAETYIPLLYIPSTWDPPPKFDKVELAIVKFDASINRMVRALPTN